MTLKIPKNCAAAAAATAKAELCDINVSVHFALIAA